MCIVTDHRNEMLVNIGMHLRSPLTLISSKKESVPTCGRASSSDADGRVDIFKRSVRLLAQSQAGPATLPCRCICILLTHWEENLTALWILRERRAAETGILSPSTFESKSSSNRFHAINRDWHSIMSPSLISE
ncbi:hypothetical protein AVEN_149767-1 [Araneus ventricosus]|uniref:Uncharacterized protein n=1 Tax=Araneus ventricosus TaxID=182803 RepID=A0A4Y2J005_ARAVE|nr:hypothetical protein AVEN_149767-1 [Araneus ventricosus]